MLATCINLLERFGTRFRITFDEAYDPAHRQRENLDPWAMQIPCRRGVIYPHGGDVLAVEVDGRPRLASQLREIPGVTELHDGNGEWTFLFPVTMFDTVAAIVLPRVKRRLTDEQKAAARERLAGYQFKSRTSERVPRGDFASVSKT